MGKTGRTAVKGVDRAKVVALKRSGMSNAEIGRELGVAGQTVFYHLKQAQTDSALRGAPEVPIRVVGPGKPNGMGEQTLNVSIAVEDVPRLPEAVANKFIASTMIREGSLRRRVLQTIAAEPRPFEDTVDLMKAMRKADPTDNFGQHEVDHIVKALKTQGLVRYRETRSGKRSWPERIDLTRAGYETIGVSPPSREVGGASGPTTRRGSAELAQHRTDRTDFRTHGSRAEGGKIERDRLPVPPQPAPVVHSTAMAAAKPAEKLPDPVSVEASWPLLAGLRAADEAWQVKRLTAGKYLAAAQLLEGIPGDEPMVESLLASAAELDTDPLTPDQREYVQFAEARK